MLVFASTLMFANQAARAADYAASSGSDSWGASTLETIVITGTKFNVDAAPSKASLDTTEPQTIINKSYIQDSAAETADYVSILAIVPSLSGLSINGPGLSDGNVKNTLRGLQDGEFGMNYDGIPFGDTNGPTHHSESYFPGSAIGGVQVDRGPGNAGNLGAATYGGTINLYSEQLGDDTAFRQTATYGSWDTFNFNTNVQTGTFNAFGPTRMMVNYQDTFGNGYLTLQDTRHDNELIKIEHDLPQGWTLTFFANRNGLHQHVNDNNGADPAQIVTFGKQFALQNTNPALATYQAYNPETKNTDMDYVRLQGTTYNDIQIDNEFYTYAYINETITTSNVGQTLADITAGKTEGLGTTVGGKKFANDIPGYTKLNAYRVWGNIFRAAKDYAVGSVEGQVRVGLWWEGAATQRGRLYFDITQCFAAGCDPWHGGAPYADTGAKKANNNTLFGPLGVGYNEHTGWQQYEPFAELEVRPFDGLTLTPGVKYVYWKHTVNAPLIAAASPPLPFCDPNLSPSHCASLSATPPSIDTAPTGSFTTTRTLPFFTANYKIMPNWSVYAQYAQGIYVPDITAFEQVKPGQYPKPQTSTNYQFGTVYYADNFSFDGDVYYIGVDNKILFVDCGQLGGSVGNSCGVNIGKATYKGVEGEATYAFDDSMAHGWLDGLVVFTNGSLNSAIAHPAGTGLDEQIAAAPYWTAAGGLIYKHDDFKLSAIEKFTGQQYIDTNYVDKNGVKPGTAGYISPFYKLPAYGNMDIKGSYTIGDFEIGAGIYNVLNTRDVVSIKTADKPTSANPLAGTAGDVASRMATATPGSSLDQYYFQPSRSFQLTLKASF